MAKKPKELKYNEFGDVMYNFGGCLDIVGNPVERDKYRYPYSYSEYVHWHCPEFEYGEHRCWDRGDYSDRLLQWNWDKHNELCQKYFGNEGQYWNNRAPELIEKWLQDYHGYPNLKLKVIIEGCNVGNGYPYWIFLYTQGEKASE